MGWQKGFELETRNRKRILTFVVRQRVVLISDEEWHTGEKFNF